MALLSQDFSFGSQANDQLTSSQVAQNSSSNPIEGIRRMTIRQLLKARKMDDDSDTFILEEKYVFKKVVLMVNVNQANVDPSTSKIKYTLDDGTGQIQGNRWPLKEGEPTIGHLGYARVIGELESFRSFKSVKIQNIRPIFDGDEIFHHFIHAIYDTVVCEKGLPSKQDYAYRHVDQDDLSRRMNNVSISGTSAPARNSGTSVSATVTTSAAPPAISASHGPAPLSPSIANLSILNAPPPRTNATASTSTAPAQPPPPPQASTSAAPVPSPGSERYLALSTNARIFFQCVIDMELDSDEDNLGASVEELLPEIIRILPDMSPDLFNNVMDQLIADEFIKINEVGDNIYFKCNLD